ncbi:MAG: hypothetical protein EHM12_08210 [Dehalococcoidia bacterium]|nr:MAG: hypothetical protein EHM12_08210 [Dehalococcoidia bacterium]
MIKILTDFFNNNKTESVFFFTILLLIVIIVALLKNKNITSKWFSITGGKKVLSALPILFEEQNRVIMKIAYNNNICLIKDQMSFVDDKSIEFQEFVARVYRHKLNAKGVSKNDVENHPQLKVLKELINSMIKDVCIDLRNMFIEINNSFKVKENELCNYDFIRVEYEKYTKRKIDFLITSTRNSIREKWIDEDNYIIASRLFWRRVKENIQTNDIELLRKLLKDFEESEMDIIERREGWESIEPAFKQDGEIYNVLRDVFRNAIEVLLKYNLIEKKLNQEIKDLIDKINEGL